jgi:hypothetical protein
MNCSRAEKSKSASRVAACGEAILAAYGIAVFVPPQPAHPGRPVFANYQLRFLLDYFEFGLPRLSAGQ